MRKLKFQTIVLLPLALNVLILKLYQAFSAPQATKENLPLYQEAIYTYIYYEAS